MAKKEDLKVVTDIKESLLEKCPERLDKIIFFGSRAQGLGRPDSDYDLLLVVDKKDRNLVDKIYEISTDYSLRNTVDISLKIYNASEYKEKNALPMPFFLNIKNKGIELWNKQKKI